MTVASQLELSEHDPKKRELVFPRGNAKRLSDSIFDVAAAKLTYPSR
jgi:hypothetical protein